MCYCTEQHGASPLPAPPGEPLAPKELQCLSETFLRFSHGALSARTAAGTRGSRHCPCRLSWDGSGAARRAERRYRVLRVLSYNSAEKGGRCHSVMLGGGAGNEGVRNLDSRHML